MDDNEIKYFIESALLAAGRPLSIDQLQHLFDDASQPEKSQLRQAISSLLDDYADRGMTITEVASGFRLQLKLEMADRLQKLWEERPPRYSRALFETVRVVGHRDVPGRPAMFGTTKMFLDYFNLKKLDDLPPLADLSDWESLRVQLNLPAVDEDEEPEPTIPVTDLPVLYPEDEDGDDAAVDDGAEVAGIEVEVEAAIETEDSASDEPRAVVEDIPDIEAALSAEGNLEPIEATEWPDPGEDQTVIRAMDEDEEADSDEEQEDDREEADSSATNVR
jgi:segregation and condensation protein B